MDEQEARHRIEEAIRRSGARFCEVRIEETVGTRVVYRGKRLDTAQELLDRGGFVRCLAEEGGWGTATFNDLDQLPRKVQEALACARAVPAARIDLAEVAPAVSVTRPPLAEDFRQVSLAEKVGLLRELNDVMLAADAAIRSTRAIYQDRVQTVYYGNSQGAWIVEERPLIDLYCVAEAVRGDDVQTATEARTLASRGFEAVRGRTEMARVAAARARELLDAEPVKGGVYPVVINPSLAGVFVHEAFGHLSESDFVYENEEAQKAMRMGRRFGRPLLNIADSGVEVPGGDLPGTHGFDDEGVPMKRTQLVKEGVLVGRLHSRETAAKLGEEPTGNARAQDYNHPPLVRMRNTFIEPGDTSFEAMISDVKLGVYALKSRGGQTCLGNFSFSSAYAYMIRDGKVAEPVRDVILAGNLFETLENVTAVGDDFSWDNSGRCGKEGQSMPVGMGSPHVRIENVVVGGR
ncbi:MAG: TldD/PmbA family protein [Planctomycetes bacterium]|nr:TldD/PmbA family protein [Planctomycetota bacterium]